MINYVYGEQLYQEFVSFRDLFLKKAVARAQHVDAASDGRPVRPVVVLPFKETDSIQAEIDKYIGKRSSSNSKHILTVGIGAIIVKL